MDKEQRINKMLLMSCTNMKKDGAIKLIERRFNLSEKEATEVYDKWRRRWVSNLTSEEDARILGHLSEPKRRNLTEDEIKEGLRRFNDGESYQEIAKDMGTNKMQLIDGITRYRKINGIPARGRLYDVVLTDELLDEAFNRWTKGQKIIDISKIIGVSPGRLGRATIDMREQFIKDTGLTTVEARMKATEEEIGNG